MNKQYEKDLELFKELGINPVDILKELSLMDEEVEKKEKRWKRERMFCFILIGLYTAYTVARVMAWM